MPIASAGRGVSLRGEPSLLLSGAWQGTSPSPSAFTSSPVSTSSTPGMPRAAVASMLADVGVRGLRAHHEGLRHVGQRDVVGIAALAGNQGLVFETPNGLANAEFHDRS